MDSLRNINVERTTFFLTTSIILLGSPGPAIATLVAIGRQYGIASGLRYLLGLQIGLAFAAAICATA
ncbi:hypothetical protein [Parasphingorhabdus cellanae]|uniref:LysE family translocator n=1 Tax=Parasphingorhabdus cellanae TaxID=2806553 RepID=A0ABX7T2B9_9SPHN|nr:hypothetical protein [Parasphingorhabdus cellanae]QTD54937.1 hypothetical protein J4G78_11875 [Parasphingorhabdus cellanae]